jgi:hypothetical protein
MSEQDQGGDDLRRRPPRSKVDYVFPRRAHIVVPMPKDQR